MLQARCTQPTVVDGLGEGAQVCASGEGLGSPKDVVGILKGETEEPGHVDGSIDVPIPRFSMGCAIAVGALQSAMVAL